MPRASPIRMFYASNAFRRLQSRLPSSLPSRFASTQQSQPPTAKAVSPHIGFYKTFARPITKVLLMATLTYQISYWAWVKLEKDEIRSERQAEISALEAELKNMIANEKGPEGAKG